MMRFSLDMATPTSAQKKRALATLDANRLRELLEGYDVSVTDRRRREDLIAALADGRRIDFGNLLSQLQRAELKRMCEELGLDSTGREKSVIIDRMLGEGAPDAAQPAVRSLGFFRRYDLPAARREGGSLHPAEHQIAALRKLRQWFDWSERPAGALLVLPTGAGKTFTATHFICSHPLSKGYKVLWLAHTHHLLEQAFFAFARTVSRIEEPKEDVRIRVVSGTLGHFKLADVRPDDDVLNATVQTVWNGASRGQRNLEGFVDSANGKLFVVVDEAHHAPAPTYRKLIEWLRSRAEVHLLGLTATPTYTDQTKRGWLDRLFPQGIIHQADVDKLVFAGVLARPKFKEPIHTNVDPGFDEGDFQRWIGTYQDIPEAIIQRLAENDGRNSLIAAEYVQNKLEYGKTIIFADRWEQCEALREKLIRHGVTAGTMYSHVVKGGGTSDDRNLQTRDDNNTVLDNFKSGKLDVIINIRMLTEGTDVPDAQTVFLTRQTTSQILLTQMIGRALRGPKFGGTEDANIVMFIDDWRHRIQWAQFDLEGLPVAPDAAIVHKHQPLQLVSIELVRRLARQMDRGENINAAPFLSFLPIGWYDAHYMARELDSEDWAEVHQLVMVFEHHHEVWSRLTADLHTRDLHEFESEEVTLGEQHDFLQALSEEYFGESNGDFGDKMGDIFAIARHVAQTRTSPAFIPFGERRDHDLDRIARAHIDAKLDPLSIDQTLRSEYVLSNRYWRAMYHRYAQFRSEYDACSARILEAITLNEDPETFKPKSHISEYPPPVEPTDEMKKEVLRRDNYMCLCCGARQPAAKLQVDHIVPKFHGGRHNLDNLQTLCKTCNELKAIRSFSFRNFATALNQPPHSLIGLDLPVIDLSAEARDQYLRRIVNMFYQCAAVEHVTTDAGNLRVDLYTGNDERWLQPHLAQILTAVQQKFAALGLTPPKSIGAARDFSGHVARVDAPHVVEDRIPLNPRVCPHCGSECPYPWCNQCRCLV